MDYKDAIAIFENNTKRSVVQIERCSVGIVNYVFIVSTANEKFVLRCSKDENAYKDTVYWLNKLSVCEIPIPIVLSEGKYKDYSYLILSYIRGDDIGNVYCKLNDSEKKQIAKEVVKIQRKVSRLDIHADMEWTWNCFVDKMLNRAEKRIKRKNYFDFNKIYIIKKLQQEIQEYLDNHSQYFYSLFHQELQKLLLILHQKDSPYIFVPFQPYKKPPNVYFTLRGFFFPCELNGVQFKITAFLIK